MFCVAIFAGEFELQVFAKNTNDKITNALNCIVEIDNIQSACNFTNGSIIATNLKLIKGQQFKVEIKDPRFVPLTFSRKLIQDYDKDSVYLEYFLCLDYTIQENSTTHKLIKKTTINVRKDGKLILTVPVNGGRALIYMPKQYTQKKEYDVEFQDNTFFFNAEHDIVKIYDRQQSMQRYNKTVQLNKNAYVTITVLASPKNVSAGHVTVTLYIGWGQGVRQVSVKADSNGVAVFNVSSFPDLCYGIAYALTVEDERFKPILYKQYLETLRWTEFVQPHLALTVAYTNQNSKGIVNAELNLSISNIVILKTRTDNLGEGNFFIPRQYNTSNSNLTVIVTFHDGKNQYKDQNDSITINKDLRSFYMSKILVSENQNQGGLIAGLCVTGVIVVGIIVTVVVVCLRKKKFNKIDEKQLITPTFV